MPKPDCITLGEGKWAAHIPILYEDRSVLAIDKPAGWMLVPFSWQRTNRNLQAAITSSLAAKDFWAKSRNLKFLRHVHRLDAETTGILLLAKNPGAVKSYGELFESRKMAKKYLAVVQGVPERPRWVVRSRLAPDAKRIGRVIVDERNGKPAETEFRVIESKRNVSLIEARPFTGRTHQIRVHLKQSGHPVMGDDLYGPRAPEKLPTPADPSQLFPMGLRAVELIYADPFRRRPVRIRAPIEPFIRAYGFSGVNVAKEPAPG